jgi:hypothetical protein
MVIISPEEIAQRRSSAMMRNVDVVNGIVIGAVTLHVRLLTPDGKEYARTCACESDAEAQEWATEVRARAIAGVGPDEAARLGWLQRWEMRIYD